MIKFRHLKVDQCPTCGNSTVVGEYIDTSNHYRRDRERQIREHTNGQRWESREFLCGCVLQWCPNYGSPEVRTVCPKHPVVVQYYKDQEKLAEKERELHEMRRELQSVDSDVKHEVNQQLRKKCSD